uniref:Mitochondrial ATP synthase subunit ASA8 n=1 Tax=Polytomella sp. Pringsheim 198.80 TaxID=37502 RepID=D8V7I7_9CHLO|nr:Chain 8, Mitochondrial ATP synthase subunit ASA8 [Polytomella sp. Pringsheim 198.80]6RD5_8 Chain 8, Mitochondrial ATP synthase subunit ASA8 [Polytomella sp. Pringsheim 198.80]6RD7_8 Chain 8, Mitochondrial ATP synthase subunit ASA8 [Polytomella sp. Pringsheim 198.80]6RD8_8 Chain 8, Mitochondrial ATP synthase subunit ASA8 [Polytomella sp. Pringsheim 198.80]6RD9_8 Chain 8, Mitochondrial ATP synthase subunit ASA8 [Polytomella sp. Pringsheim 198.80]6RDA_8 Chain 8, Mitochondrial ATP synthase subu|eukprot:CAMPEP_0175061936 /NCGR_PEP_ID=MMETSP0052_2-20121109/13869_1 /TAXON_ID=51329 ORGANISM="Polytomella parva, Strain SAG 63-3" /NCGR_SAMPLE_ID=MMETSP0052_2 /ASSEMBLY_ACC=CAM_ASM_000194 /LENGTH=89 /DNA_ID=CAMNT_0016327861 /DNA_START=45 /DNA_END=314 /DNA_ORIENTATION=+
MVLGEVYLKDILRTPPTGAIPANVPHPFQTSFYTYATKKLIPRHWYLLGGFTFTITLYGILDGLRDSGKKKAYDEAIHAGKTPYTAGGH